MESDDIKGYRNITLSFQSECTQDPSPVQLFIEWDPADITDINSIFFEMKNSSPSSDTTFHAFLDPTKKVHELPIKLSPNIDKYMLFTYGLVLCNAIQDPCYKVCASAKCEMVKSNALSRFEFDEKIKLTKGTNYCSVYTARQVSFGSTSVRARNVQKSQYELFGDCEFETVIVVVNQRLPNATFMFYSQISKNKPISIQMTLRPATRHDIYIHEVTTINTIKRSRCYVSSKFTKIEDYTTYMTKTELNVLFGKAKRFIGNSGSVRLDYLYRNKPVEYFQNIYRHHGGIMVPYIKDNNGDPASVINGNINGLFFSATVDEYSRPLHASYFGKRRLHVMSKLLFHRNSTLYFADFYCHYSPHYVTLVLTEEGSDVDTFCRVHLLRLNIYDNPFLNIVPFTGNFDVYVTLGVRVEILYTESLDLRYIGDLQGNFLFEDVPLLGRGCSKQNGIPKNPNCKTCNI